MECRGRGFNCDSCMGKCIDYRGPLKTENEKIPGSKISENKLYFAMTNENATIPTKNKEDAGYDIYPCFEGDYIIIEPLETLMIPTGIATSFDKSYYAQIQERGSTGSKGIKYGAGVIDSGYRGEWFIPITNVNNKALVISKLSHSKTLLEMFKNPNHRKFLNNPIIYPYEKAIAQFVILPVPEMDICIVDYNDLKNIKSKRGCGSLGSSKK